MTVSYISGVVRVTRRVYVVAIQLAGPYARHGLSKYRLAQKNVYTL